MYAKAYETILYVCITCLSVLGKHQQPTTGKKLWLVDLAMCATLKIFHDTKRT